MCYARQLKSLVEFQEFQALQTQAEQLHGADQAAIVIEGAAVTYKQTHRGFGQSENSVPRQCPLTADKKGKPGRATYAARLPELAFSVD